MARKWTDEEIQFLKFAYPNKDFTSNEICEALKRDLRSVRSKASQLKLKRYKETFDTEHKRCSKCKNVLPLIFFTKRKNRYDSWCHECYKIAKKKIEDTVSEDTVSEDTVSEDTVLKQCTKCGELKIMNDFYNDKTSPDGKLAYCKKCRNKQVEEYKLKKLKERGW